MRRDKHADNLSLEPRDVVCNESKYERHTHTTLPQETHTTPSQEQHRTHTHHAPPRMTQTHTTCVVSSLTLKLLLSRNRCSGNLCWSRTRQLTPSPCWRSIQCYYSSSWRWKGSRNCLRLMENKESRKMDGMESSESKSDAHFMHGRDETNTRTT